MFRIKQVKVLDVGSPICSQYKGKVISYEEYDKALKFNLTKYSSIPFDSKLEVNEGDVVEIVSSESLNCEGYLSMVIRKVS